MKTFIQLILKCLLILGVFMMMVVSLSDDNKSKLKYDLLRVLFKGNRENQAMVIETFASEIQDTKPKKIYLYNTHQSEEYIDGMTIFDVTEMFAKLLESEGFDVVFERSDFLSELQSQNKEYHQLYSISKVYLEQAIRNEGPFDLIIDVHRDSTSRSVSVVEQGGISYARLMFVIGEKSSNSKQVRELSVSYSDKMNESFSGIMREPFTRQSEYNQGVADNMLLLEVGSDQNTSSEAIRSLRILVDMLKREGWS